MTAGAPMADARAAFAAAYGLMPADLAAFDRYTTLLAEWQGRMNLVAASTLPEVWTRHFADSAQLVALAEADETTTWLDLGSGAGFPALVVARLAPGRVHLVEATAKKCAFLAVAAEALGVGGKVVIHNARIEDVPTLAADRVTARACAPLAKLFGWGERFAHGGRWLLPKGRTVEAEIEAARDAFTFDHELVASRTDPQARIVVAGNVRRRR